MRREKFKVEAQLTQRTQGYAREENRNQAKEYFGMKIAANLELRLHAIRSFSLTPRFPLRSFASFALNEFS
jgi:hypothetical protein